MKTGRIYIVTTPSGVHYVSAIGPALAVKAVTQSGVSVRAAKTADMVEAMKKNVAIIDAETVLTASPAPETAPESGEPSPAPSDAQVL